MSPASASQKAKRLALWCSLFSDAAYTLTLLLTLLYYELVPSFAFYNYRDGLLFNNDLNEVIEKIILALKIVGKKLRVA